MHIHKYWILSFPWAFGHASSNFCAPRMVLVLLNPCDFGIKYHKRAAHARLELQKLVQLVEFLEPYIHLENASKPDKVLT